MRERCSYPSNASFPHYGGRGIKVCPEWRKFQNFLADMGERPEGTNLSRLDHDKNYEPGNVIWQNSADNFRENINRNRDRLAA